MTANWFTAKRGLAISIALSGSGFGGAILSPIVSSLIVSVGWRSAFLVLAAVCMVAALPITAYSFRTKPSEIGLKPLGENPGDPSVSTAGDKDEHTAPEVSVGWSRIKKSPAFWLLVVAFLFMGLVNGAILPNQVTNMTSVTVNGAKIVTGGHDPMWAGTVLSAYMVTVVIAKISLGAIYDRFGLRFGNILGSVACIIACVALCFPTTDLGPIVAAVSFGIGTCMGTITPTIAASKQFGMADLGKVTGTITSLEMVGGTVGAIVSGVLFDATGSFASTWIVCLACSVVMLVFLLASEPIAAKLRAAGCEVEEFDDALRITRTGELKPLKLKTMPHPGFPTDMQPLMTALLTLAKGTSIVTEGIWENRFRYVDELIHMGANIQVDGQVAVIEGVKELHPAPLRATDLRAGAAMVMAALAANGVSEVDETIHIERGYENIVEKLQALGADIRRVEIPANAVSRAI